MVGNLLDLLHQARAPEPCGRHRRKTRLPGADRVLRPENRRRLHPLPAFRTAEFPAGRVQTALFDREYRLRAPQVRVHRIPAVAAPADGLQRRVRTLGHGPRHGRHALRRVLQSQRVQCSGLQLRRVQRRRAERQGQEQIEGPCGAADAASRPGIADRRFLLLGRVWLRLPQARPLRCGRLLRRGTVGRARRVDLRHDGASRGRRTRQRRLVRRRRVARDAVADVRGALRYVPRKLLGERLAPDQLHGGRRVAAREIPALPAQLHLRRLCVPRRRQPQCGVADALRNFLIELP